MRTTILRCTAIWILGMFRTIPVQAQSSNTAEITSIEGIIRDESDKPVQGAHVVASGTTPRYQVLGETTTDAQGHYLIQGLAADKPPDFVTIEEFGEYYTALEPAEPSLNIRLYRKRRYSVQAVHGDSGEPAKRYRCMFSRQEPDGLICSQTRESNQKGIAEGSVERKMRRYSQMQLEVVALDEKGRATDEYGTTEVKMGANEVNHFTVRLAKGRKLRGQVVRADTGAPVPDFKIAWDRVAQTPPIETDRRLWSSNDENVPTAAVTNAQGEFEILFIPVGARKLVAPPDQKGFYLAAPAVAIIPPNGDPNPVTIKVYPSSRVQGRVFDRDGMPASGILVSIKQKVGKTDENGNYRLEDVEPGRHEVSAQQPARKVGDEYMMGWEIDNKTVQVEAGKNLELSFDPSSKIRLICQLRINGELQTARDVMFLSKAPARGEASDSEVLWAPRRPSYEGEPSTATLEPGTWFVRESFGGGEGPGRWNNGSVVVDRIVVTESSAEQHHTIEFETTSLSIVSKGFFATSRDRIILTQRFGSDVMRAGELRPFSPVLSFLKIPTGEYQACLVTEDGVTVAESDWVKAETDKDNVIALRPAANAAAPPQ